MGPKRQASKESMRDNSKKRGGIFEDAPADNASIVPPSAKSSKDINFSHGRFSLQIANAKPTDTWSSECRLLEGSTDKRVLHVSAEVVLSEAEWEALNNVPKADSQLVGHIAPLDSEKVRANARKVAATVLTQLPALLDYVNQHPFSSCDEDTCTACGLKIIAGSSELGSTEDVKNVESLKKFFHAPIFTTPAEYIRIILNTVNHRSFILSRLPAHVQYRSYMQDTFEIGWGQLWVCTSCEKVAESGTTSDFVMKLEVPPTEETSQNLQELWQSTYLTHATKRCTKCRKEQVHKRRVDLTRLPDVLLLHISRFSPSPPRLSLGHERVDKSRAMIQYDKNIDFVKLTGSNGFMKPTPYSLLSTVDHQGIALNDEGHFCYFAEDDDGKLRAHDGETHTADEEANMLDLKKGHVYDVVLLVYIRQKKAKSTRNVNFQIPE